MAEIKIISRVIPRGGSGASAPSAGGGFSAPVDISGKLDKSVWNSAFELHYDDPDDPEKLTSIGAKTNFFSVGEISVFGKGGSSGGGGGATTLHMLEDVDLVMPIPDGDVLTYDAKKGRWTNKKGTGGIDTKAMWEELGKSDISKKIDISHIPDLGSVYAKQVKLGTTPYNVSNGVVSLPAYPTALRSPNALTISLNGKSQGGYDGSSAKSINITPSSIGAALSSDLSKYVLKSGDTITGNLAVNGEIDCNVIGENVNDAHDGDSPWYGIRFTGGASGMDISGYYGIGFYTSNGRMIYLGNNQSHIVNLYAEGNANTDSSFVSSMTDSWQLQWPIYFNPDNAVFRANQFSLMMHDSCRPIISWKDALAGAGWQTRYTIGTYRPDYDTWGTMLIAVSNDDGGNSPGIRLELEASNNRAVVQGSFLASGEITAYSDARLKSSIKPLRNRGFITPVSYIKDGKESIGFIAQDMIELYPELVSKGSSKEHYLSVNYAQYTAVLQAQIIELHKEIDDLKRKFIN
jgi:hypothetical protein